MDIERLLDAAEAGATIVAANARTQRRLRRLYDARQQQRHSEAWLSPPILAWNAWLDRLWEEYVLAAGAPLRLNSAQQRFVWERIIRGSDAGRELIAVTAAADLAREAWTLLQQFRVTDLSLLSLTADGSAFQKWALAYAAQCARNGWTDDACLPELLRGAIENLELVVATRLFLVGFDELTPQQESLLAAVRAAGNDCEVVGIDELSGSGTACRIALDDRAAEVQVAAEWARERLRVNPGASIGIVVPGFEGLRDHIERVFAEVLTPESLLAAEDKRRVFELSLGHPLSEIPMVRAALQLLRWAEGRLPIAAAGVLIRSVYLKGGDAEASARARLDAKMCEWCGPEVSIEEVKRLAGARHGDGTARPHHCSLLKSVLGDVERHYDRSPKSPGKWSEHFDRLLQAAGWPGDRPLNSAEHQVREAWVKVLRTFATLEAAVPSLSSADALAQLVQLASSRVFQPENVGAPVQVMGPLEASGSRFDHLWVMGLDDETWPGRATPNPLIPLAVQRRYRLPHSSAADDLAFASRITDRLRSSAREVVFSYPRLDGDRVLRPSPLLTAVRQRELGDVLPEPGATWVTSIQAAAEPLESISDAPPPVSDDDVRGGTRIFQLQAACPFRAFATLRLNASELEEPVAGLSPADRGSLVHMVLQFVWQRLDGSEDLARLDPDQQRALIRECADEALNRQQIGSGGTWHARFAVLERERLIALVSAWLDKERQRAPFRVIEREEKKALELGGVKIEMRVDRVDELASGGKVILDYKTGRPKKLEDVWDGERPDEPQLPLYAVGESEQLRALAFAHLRTGELTFRGEAEAPGILPEVRVLEDITMRDRIAEWQRVLAALGESFRRGDMATDPKDPEESCKYCPFPPLCRPYESAAGDICLANEEEGTDAQ